MTTREGCCQIWRMCTRESTGGRQKIESGPRIQVFGSRAIVAGYGAYEAVGINATLDPAGIP